MKTLYLIGGTMGVGKTTVCQLLKQKLDRCVFLDGDWCWNMHPFTVNEETKAMVEDNICHLLNNFLHCAEYNNILFCWVMHKQSIIDGILARLDTDGVLVRSISLVCNEEALRTRLEGDVAAGLRTPDVIVRSVERIPLYYELNTLKIDVSALSVGETAELILRQHRTILMVQSRRQAFRQTIQNDAGNSKSIAKEFCAG